MAYLDFILFKAKSKNPVTLTQAKFSCWSQWGWFLVSLHCKSEVTPLRLICILLSVKLLWIYRGEKRIWSMEPHQCNIVVRSESGPWSVLPVWWMGDLAQIARFSSWLHCFYTTVMLLAQVLWYNRVVLGTGLRGRAITFFKTPCAFLILQLQGCPRSCSSN